MKFSQLLLDQNGTSSQLFDSSPPFFPNALKPFMCGECGTSYKNKGDLNAHVRSNCNQNKRFQCPNCPYRSYRIGNINSHISRVHKQH